MEEYRVGLYTLQVQIYTPEKQYKVGFSYPIGLISYLDAQV